MNPIKSAYRAAREAGSALRFHLGPLLRRKPAYGIAAGYRHRDHVNYYDDTENSDEWQREVYEEARSLMVRHQLRTVIDVGCGGGFKLVQILGEFETVGVDLPETIKRVRMTYPDRFWVAGSFEEIDLAKADLVLCADVIEHVANPDALMRFIARVAKDRVVISTPDRDLEYKGRTRYRFGPPANRAHVREWNLREFGSYVAQFLHVDKHEISNRQQATQMVVGRVRGRSEPPPVMERPD